MSAPPVYLLLALTLPLEAQPARQAAQLDLQGKGAEARFLLEQAVSTASTPKAKADAQRALAMSWAFEGNCLNAREYEFQALLYRVSREDEDPADASYQEGEIADEAGRICIDAGDLAMARQWYRKGHDAGSEEPGISADRQDLWDFRQEHAQALINAAQAALDRMTQSRAPQQAFLPYLTGYVAFCLGDYGKALADLQQAPANDPFIQCLLGQTYEKLGQGNKATEATEYYRKAAASTAHNPPAVYAVPFARKKLS